LNVRKSATLGRPGLEKLTLLVGQPAPIIMREIRIGIEIGMMTIGLMPLR
jgi:hypothetical protein